MLNKLNTILCLCFFLLLLHPNSYGQKNKKGKKPKPTTETPKKVNKKAPPKGGPKPYEKVITEKAVSQKGLITTHKVGDKYYFELPIDLLEKEIMVVSRISGYVKNLSFGGAGMKSRPQQATYFSLI